jgi:hypothetical protein
MTKKHFIDLADTVVDIVYFMSADDRNKVISEMISFCKRNGSNFDEGRFRNYISERLDK